MFAIGLWARPKAVSFDFNLTSNSANGFIFLDGNDHIYVPFTYVNNNPDDILSNTGIAKYKYDLSERLDLYIDTIECPFSSNSVVRKQLLLDSSIYFIGNCLYPPNDTLKENASITLLDLSLNVKKHQMIDLDSVGHFSANSLMMDQSKNVYYIGRSFIHADWRQYLVQVDSSFQNVRRTYLKDGQGRVFEDVVDDAVMVDDSTMSLFHSKRFSQNMRKYVSHY